MDGEREKNIADYVAVEAMRERVNKVHIRGCIFIGEREGNNLGEEVKICTQEHTKAFNFRRTH